MQVGSVAELVDSFEKQLRNLNELVQIRSLKDADIVLEELASSVSDVNALFKQIQFEVQRQKSFESRIAELKPQHDMILQRYDHAVKNVPDRLPKSEDHAKENCPPVIHPPSSQKNSVQQRSSKANKTSTRCRLPSISYVTVDEFSAVPAYAKGRIAYDEINKVIDELNKVLAAKYRLLGLPKHQLSDAEWRRMEEFKDQENKDSQGTVFFVEGDVKSFSALKVDRRLLSILGILRHLSRLREVRGGQLTRYVCVTQHTNWV